MKLSNAEKSNLEQVATYVQWKYNGKEQEVVRWFRHGVEKDSTVPDNVSAIEAGLQYMRSELAANGEYKHSALPLAKRISDYFIKDERTEAAQQPEPVESKPEIQLDLTIGEVQGSFSAA